MENLSEASEKRLESVDPKLAAIVRVVAAKTDLYVLCGHRDETEQNQALETGKSRVKWPNSRHNSLPSEAVDLAPNPLNWNDIESFKRLNQLMMAEAALAGIELEWGGDFHALKDYDHWQLKRKDVNT